MSNFLYNPDRKSKDQLLAEFVVRTDLFSDIMSDLETSAMTTPEQHYLLVGQRGTGKTTLLNRIKYAVEDSEKLKEWLVPVLFTEEQYNISELANLWENVAHNLEDYYGFTGIVADMELHISKSNFEELCYDILEKNLERNKKKLVILLDNFGDFLRKLREVEIRRLREILQTKPYIRLIAGSPFYLESILDYKQPLFEFFKVKRLEGLNKNESKKLLLKLGEVYNEKEKIERIISETPERIETLRILTGGVPRTIALMFRIFIDHEHESSLKDLERVLDAVTPLYKHRMDDLSKQQQRIIDAVARNWDAISVKELRERTRLESKIISAQLRQLEKNQIIEKRATDTKNHLYLLKERFWNIWYLMRYGRKDDSERVVWLVRFLESWCSDFDFEKRINLFVSQLNSGGIDSDTARFYSEVYTSLKKISSPLKYLLKESIPANISRKILLSENEVFDLSEKYCNENNEDKAINMLLEQEVLSLKNKKLLYEILKKLSVNKFKHIVKTLFENIPQSIKDKEVSEMTPGLSLFVVFGFLLTLTQDLENNDSEKIDEGVESVIQIINERNKDEIDYEVIILSMLISFLLIYENYNLVNKIFKEINVINLKDKIKPVYYAFVKNRDGTESVEFKSMGSEIAEASKGIIAAIEDYKVKYLKLAPEK